MASRILLVIPTLDRNGAEKQLVLLAQGLPKNEFDVHVCALTRGGPLTEPLKKSGIPLTIIDKSWKIDPAAWWRLRRMMLHLRPDIVHTWIFAANSYGRHAARSAGVPHIIAGERCVDPWKRWHEFAIDRYLAGFTDRIVTNSSGVVDFYARHGLPADKFIVIPNGIPVTSPTTAISRDELLKSLQLPDDACLIGAVGRLWPQKRYKDLIWAMELLKSVRPDAYLLIIGDGPQRWRLERYVRQVQLSDRVHLLGERSDVATLLPHLNCFWLGSGYEGQSNGLMEAMLAGIPAVATDIPGNRDLVIPGKTGYLVPVGDRAEFARWAAHLLNNPQVAKEFGQRAQQRMRTEFNVDRMVSRHAELYRSL